MNTIGEEMRFEQLRDDIEIKLNVAAKTLDLQKIERIQGQLKEIARTVGKIEEVLKGNRRLNPTDVKNKVQNYRQEVKELHRRLDEVNTAYQKKQLMMHKASNEETAPFQDNRRLLAGLAQNHELITRNQRLFNETDEVLGNIREELGNQRPEIEGIQDEVGRADAELTMIDQFMRTISNRNLLTKVILILLALFLAFADIAILVLKIL